MLGKKLNNFGDGRKIDFKIKILRHSREQQQQLLLLLLFSSHSFSSSSNYYYCCCYDLQRPYSVSVQTVPPSISKTYNIGSCVLSEQF